VDSQWAEAVDGILGALGDHIAMRDLSSRCNARVSLGFGGSSGVRCHRIIVRAGSHPNDLHVGFVANDYVGANGR
jgi:hypothetical protein